MTFLENPCCGGMAKSAVCVFMRVSGWEGVFQGRCWETCWEAVAVDKVRADVAWSGLVVVEVMRSQIWNICSIYQQGLLALSSKLDSIN